MANPEHLKILKQGVKAWNEWRKVNPHFKPDLRGANLIETGFAGIAMANLSGADLREAWGHGHFALEVDFSNADLRKAFFQDCKFFSANFKNANLSESTFSGCEFPNANFEFCNLTRACLYMSTLGANFYGADLCEADLRCCLLIHAKFKNANINGALLWGTSRDFWKIEGVRCDYVYWDGPGKQRCPKERYFEPGEFERLYAALPTIEYIFENGMSPLDPLIMDRVVQAIREKKPEFDIKIDSINARGLAPSIKFTVQHEEYKEPALEEVRKGYEERISCLEAEKDRLYNLLGQAIDKAGDVRLITGSIVAMDNATINIEQHIDYAVELQRAIAGEPEKSKSFAKIAKKTALDVIGEAIKDVAKGQVKEAAKQIIELGKELGPIIVKTAAYGFFKNML